MGKRAEKVYVEAVDIARLEQRVEELPSDAHVRITLENGEIFTGIVAERPSMQVFEDSVGAEGLNGLVRIENAAAPSGSIYVWLDVIVRVERIVP